MSYTILAAPEHILPQTLSMPTMKDPVGNGTTAFRRLQKRPLSSWELVVPGRQELLGPVLGLLEHVQGDTPFWFDGAGFGEVVSPILVGHGANTTDYALPHRYVFITSLVVYINGAATGNWIPLGSTDGIVCDAIRFDTAITNANYTITAKYRRRIKCVLRTEDKPEMSRGFRSNVVADNLHRLKLVIEEVAI
jgi:hypothetical protein